MTFGHNVNDIFISQVQLSAIHENHEGWQIFTCANKAYVVS